MTEKRVSYRYARALLETAISEKLADRVYEDFDFVAQTFKASTELKSITGSPIFQQWRKKNIYKAIFADKVSQLSLDFLILLIDKRRGELIPDIIAEYIELYNKANDLLRVDITSAVDLNNDSREKIIKRLADMTNFKILPEYHIDANLIGGMQVRIEDWVYDSSIRHQLGQLYKQLSEGDAK